MKTKVLALCVAMLSVTSAASAQVDEFPFTRAVIVNSPGAITGWPATAQITRVHFEMGGWLVEFDHRRGPSAWPDVRTPGWGDQTKTCAESADGCLQYTLGLCRKMTPSWVCSSVVQFWHDRLEQEGVMAGAPPNEIGKEWFYDGRWGALAGWQPALGEEVGVYLQAGDGRNTTVAFPGTVPQRTAARLIRWGTDVGAPAGGGTQPTEPSQPQQPSEPQQPTHPSEPQQPSQPTLDLSGIAAQIDALGKAVQAVDAHLTKVEADVNNPGWLGKARDFLFKNPIGMGITGALSTCLATQCWAHIGGK